MCRIPDTDTTEGAQMNPAAKKPDETTYSGRFAARLRMLREKAGLSVEQVVEGISKHNRSERKPPKLQAYYGWEQGRAAPHMDLLPAIAKAFKSNVRELMPEK